MTMSRRLYALVGPTALLLCVACNQDPAPRSDSVVKKQEAIATSSDSVSLEDKARQLYEHALVVRKGRGDKGLSESMEIFKVIIKKYPETSAARDAETQLAASEEVVQKLGQLRKEVQRAEETQGSFRAEESGACPESVTYDLCRRIHAQDIGTTVKMKGILGSCSMEEATAILQKCTEIVRR